MANQKSPEAMVLNDPDENGESGHVDRLSQLPDHVLVLVLERLGADLRQIARTRVLSKRWATLPLMLSRLEIAVESFLPARHGSTARLPVRYRHRATRKKKKRYLHRATSRFTDALRFFLATPTGGQRNIKTLVLRFTLTKHHRRLNVIARLVSGAVSRGEVQHLEVGLDTVKSTWSLERLQADAGTVAGEYARRFMSLLRATPAGVLGPSLRKLALRNLCFRRSSDFEDVLRACEALETLQLSYCWFSESWEVFRIDAPRSRLKELQLTECSMERVDLVHAPALSHLSCEMWDSEACPVAFGPSSVPALVGITLVNHQEEPQQRSFKLSDLLQNTNLVEQMHLDFCANKIWLELENPRNLCVAFSKLRKLHLTNIFAGANILWTMFLLKAAPLLELMDIHVCDNHICGKAHDGNDAEDLEWKASEDHFEHRHLQMLEIRGGLVVDKDLRFVRLVMDRAVNLKLLLLNAEIRCTDCISTKQQGPFVVLYRFPEDKDSFDSLAAQGWD